MFRFLPDFQHNPCSPQKFTRVFGKFDPGELLSQFPAGTLKFRGNVYRHIDSPIVLTMGSSPTTYLAVYIHVCIEWYPVSTPCATTTYSESSRESCVKIHPTRENHNETRDIGDFRRITLFYYRGSIVHPAEMLYFYCSSTR